MNWLKRWFSSPQPETAGRVLALEREVQNLRLELQEREQAAARLQQDLERLRSGASTRLNQAVAAQLEQLLGDAASPVVQLVTQAHLLEVEGKPVQARDVLAVAKRLVRLLEDHGLILVGQVGQQVNFDPDQHEPLQTGANPTTGQTVVIRFVGVTYQGKLLRKAGVIRDAGPVSD